MSLPGVHVQPPPVLSAIGFRGLVAAKARPLVAGLLLLALLLVYCSVVQGSVQRGQQLNRQMADFSSQCDASASRSRAPHCTTLAQADAVRSPLPQPQPAAAH